MPNIPGSDLSSIFVLRDYTDAQGVYSLLSPEKHVIVLGLGFIGMEAAAYCVDKCASVTVIGRDTVPLKAIFGADIGNRIKKEHETKGFVQSHMHEIYIFRTFLYNKLFFRREIYLSK